jgi:phage terminase large subunit-like protein
MKGVLEATGWAEWSIPHITKNVRDRTLWYETNPSLGIILTERAIEAELEESDDVVDFCIQRLGVWLRYNQKSAITTEDWNKLKVEGEITISGKIYAGVKFGKDGENACLSVAIKTTDGRVFVECLDCQPIRNGNGWIVEYLKALKPNGIWIDGANGQQLLADDLKEAKVRHVTLPSVNQIVAAAAAFEQGIFDEQICHAGQPSMVQAATNCEKRAIGSKGGFGYRSLKEGVEIGILESAMTAFYQCSQSKERNAQRIKA